jgi:hypothetical protein
VRDVGDKAGRLHRSKCTLVTGTGTQNGAERLQNARTLGTLKRKGYLPVLGGLSGGLCLLPNHWKCLEVTGGHWRSLEVTLEVTVKVTVPILTAPVPRTRWQSSLRSPTYFAHFYSETLKESREQKKRRPLCREVPWCSTDSLEAIRKKFPQAHEYARRQPHKVDKWDTYQKTP